MDSSKIEVGDVFTCDGQGQRELVALGVDERFVHFAIDGVNYYPLRSECHLVRKADPYHGITLPSPPAGYRLAKWGEELPKGSQWWDCGDEGTNGEWDDDWCRSGWPWSQWKAGDAWLCIFAIPLDQPSPLKSWQFREVPWVAPEPRTLAGVPDDTDCIAAPRYKTNAAAVVFRRGDTVLFRNGDWSERVSSWLPVDWQFVRYLDPRPQKPLSIDDVPDGRVIRCQNRWHWKVGATWWRLSDSGGVWPNLQPKRESEFTITNYIAEFREPS